MAPSVLVVDDQAAFRAVARQVLERDGFDVVGEAADGASALTAERELRPDVVLLDVRLPDIDGVEVARRMSAVPSAPAVVLVSTADYAHAVAGCGAAGFLAKVAVSGPALRSALAERR